MGVIAKEGADQVGEVPSGLYANLLLLRTYALPPFTIEGCAAVFLRTEKVVRANTNKQIIPINCVLVLGRPVLRNADTAPWGIQLIETSEEYQHLILQRQRQKL